MDSRIERLRRRANAYSNAGDLHAATVALESLLAECPTDDAARLDLALLRLRAGHYRDAHAHTLKACIQDPGNPDLLKTRLEALRVFSEHGRMRLLARQAEPASMASVDDLAAVAGALESFGDCEQATRWIEQAVSRSPADPLISVKQAMVDLDCGRVSDAENNLERVTAGARPIAMAHWLLSGLRRQTDKTNHVLRLRSLLEQGQLDPLSQAQVGFALHKELDDLGCPAEAWIALQAACQAKRSTLDYDQASTATLFDQLIETFSDEVTGNEASSTRGSPTPVFIVGMFRSGTTLLERILEAHPQVAAGGESRRLTAQLRCGTDSHGGDVVDAAMLSGIGRIDAVDMSNRYLAAHDWLLDGRSHFTEKLPSNFQLIGFIRRFLPHAKVLHLVREPMDTCWSNLRELFAGAAVPYSYEQLELADYHRQYQRLMQHWHRQYPGFIHDVAYADLVSEPKKTANAVMSFCGLPWVEGCTSIERNQRPVRTASAMQVRRPINSDSIGRWKPYAKWLVPLSEALACSSKRR